MDVHRDHDGGQRWYASPFWIGIGIGIVALLAILVLAMVSRGGSSGGTTIVKT